jgi:hypothetical protein
VDSIPVAGQQAQLGPAQRDLDQVAGGDRPAAVRRAGTASGTGRPGPASPWASTSTE